MPKIRSPLISTYHRFLSHFPIICQLCRSILLHENHFPTFLLPYFLIYRGFYSSSSARKCLLSTYLSTLSYFIRYDFSHYCTKTFVVYVCYMYNAYATIHRLRLPAISNKTLIIDCNPGHFSFQPCDALARARDSPKTLHAKNILCTLTHPGRAFRAKFEFSSRAYNAVYSRHSYRILRRKRTFDCRRARTRLHM